MDTAYFEHKGTVVDKGNFKHVMALSLDSNTNYKKGLIRCITERSGDLGIKGNVDRSQLYLVEGDSLEKFKITSRLHIEGEEEVVRSIGKYPDFIGLEDPDIWFDEITGKTHVYFTIPFEDVKTKNSKIFLGHAEGEGLNSLTMTDPVMSPTDDDHRGAKELSMAPVNKQGVRLNLVESADIVGGTHYYSVIRIAIAEDMGINWKYGKIEFHPRNKGLKWCKGHVSPGPLLPKSFIDVGENKLLGILNGSESDMKKGDETVYGVFSVGLMIYNYEEGKIEWFSEKPLIRDSQAKIITFASQFVQTKDDEGYLYAHVDDSFVRAYTLSSHGLKSLLP